MDAATRAQFFKENFSPGGSQVREAAAQERAVAPTSSWTLQRVEGLKRPTMCASSRLGNRFRHLKCQRPYHAKASGPSDPKGSLRFKVATTRKTPTGNVVAGDLFFCASAKCVSADVTSNVPFDTVPPFKNFEFKLEPELSLDEEDIKELEAEGFHHPSFVRL
jgi:hypothetical protein